MTWLVVVPALLYLAYGGALWWFQDTLIFPAPGGIGRDALDQAAAEVGATPLGLVSGDGTRIYAWHRRVPGADRLVIYFPGNAETVADNLPLQRLLLQAGWDVLAVAYRGYPGSEGRPTEAGLAADARAAWAWATGEGGYRPERIVLHGRSLGGGVAAHLAEDRNPAAMVLESTFASVRELAARQAPIYPVDWLLRHPFDTRSRAARFGVPVLLLHSRDDEVIPIGHGGRALRELIAEVEYHETSTWTHGHCLPVADPELRAAYLSFLARAVP